MKSNNFNELNLTDIFFLLKKNIKLWVLIFGVGLGVTVALVINVTEHKTYSVILMPPSYTKYIDGLPRIIKVYSTPLEFNDVIHAAIVSFKEKSVAYSLSVNNSQLDMISNIGPIVWTQL